ncbi:hypothetical protein QQG91_06400 [Marivivens sp. LCG002]|uniref:hypothetical protein n=1 Tax=Marivivens sp. LCG002 TaxID=3051171 RepID=UPI0025525E6F|nr:hypothetical protein [Marivivens sp. LCG002]WIV52067.1 hypothetical protein QQG91_06400 [Marivivens sp. LCG002]
MTRRAWENHNERYFGGSLVRLGAPFFSTPPEMQHITNIEQTGTKSLNELLAYYPVSDNAKLEDWHEFITRAQLKSTEIERLKLRLEGPKPFPR